MSYIGVQILIHCHIYILCSFRVQFLIHFDFDLEIIDRSQLKVLLQIHIVFNSGTIFDAF